MPRAAIIQPDQSYTFADYFKLNFAPQDVLAYFNVSLQRRALNLPRYSGSLDRLTDLKTPIEVLPLPQLEALTETLLDFNHLEALLTWLQVNQPSAADRPPEVRE